MKMLVLKTAIVRHNRTMRSSVFTLNFLFSHHHSHFVGSTLLGLLLHLLWPKPEGSPTVFSSYLLLCTQASVLNYLPSQNLFLGPGCQCHVPDVLDLDFLLSEDSASPHDPPLLSCQDTMLPSPSPSAFLWYISPAVCS